MEIVLDGLLVHLHTAAFAFASQLAVLQLLFGFRDAPLDLRLPESALRQFFFGVRTLLRFGGVHGRRKSRTAALERPSSVSKGEAMACTVRVHSDPVGSTTPKTPPPPLWCE